MMTVQECLENDRERLLAELTAAGSPEKAVPVIEREADRLLLLYNDSCGDARTREAAAGSLQVLRLCAALIGTGGAVKVWEERSPDLKSGRLPAAGIAFLALAGLAALGGLLTALFISPEQFRAADILLAVLLTAAAPALGMLAGLRCGRGSMPANLKSGAYHTEQSADPSRIYTVLHNAVCAIDRQLEMLPAEPAPEEGAEVPGTDPAVIDLAAGLLEAACGGDGAYALEKLEDVRLFLHRRGIEAVDYDGSNGALFDLMPSRSRHTLRPALTADGTLIRRGLAAGGQE